MESHGRVVRGDPKRARDLGDWFFIEIDSAKHRAEGLLGASIRDHAPKEPIEPGVGAFGVA